jgi:hypothetical protein
MEMFRGLNFSRNADIGQIGQFWMGDSEQSLFSSPGAAAAQVPQPPDRDRS